MSAKIRPLAQITREAETILIRELGIADALRFLSQYRTGTGDYTDERSKWLDDLSVDDIVAQIKRGRRKARGGKR